MSYQVLARKWRPKNFSEMVGQTQALQGLMHALDQGRLHHAYLFTGTRGVGKTSIARILAKCLNCEVGISSKPCGECLSCREIAEGRFPDLIEIDAASRTKVEDTREILDNVQYAPTRGRFKVYLIDEVHMLSGHSFNALLKTLEEPPSHVKFLLATTDPQKLPITVLSRCLQFNLKPIQSDEIAKHLSKILEAEQISFEAHALSLIGRAAKGSLRDALSLLDQAIAFGQGRVLDQSTATMLGSINRDEVFSILEALASKNAEALMACTCHLAEKGADFASVLAELARLLYQVALRQMIPTIESEDFPSEKLAQAAKAFSAEELQVLYQIANMGKRDLSLAPDERVGFEMTLLRMLAFSPLSLETIQQTPKVEQAKPQFKPAPASVPQSRPVATALPAKSLAPVEAAAPVKPVEVSSPSINLSTDKIDWAALLPKLGLNGFAKQLALNCVLVGQSPEQIKLMVEETHRNMLNDRVRLQIEQAMQPHLGKVKLVIEVGKATEETPAAVDKRVAETKHQAAQETLLQDKHIQFMQAQFNATIDVHSIKPRE